MDRRKFLKRSIVAGLATAVESHAQRKASAGKPNVLYLLSDQHRALSLPGEAFNQALAPNLDAFCHQNFSMEQCVSNYPLCAPYRGILMSGRWSYQTGVVTNWSKLSASEVSLGDLFRDHGYHTGYIGKWHLGPEGFIPKGPQRLGFEDWHVWDKTNDHYHSWTYDQETGEKISPEGWNATRMTDQAVDFLKAQSGEKPWFLIVSWNPPHPPFNPPKEDASLYPVDELKFRPNVKLALPDQKINGEAIPLQSEQSLRAAMQGYDGAITGIDIEFARILRALDETGRAGETIVVYTSDHGEMMGSHGRMGKQVPFEESCRVPFFVRYPGVTPDHGRSDLLFATVDIYPTLCGLAGIPVPSHCAGRDFSAAIRGKKAKPPEIAFLMNELPPDLKNSGNEKAEAALYGVQPGPDSVMGTNKFVNQPSYRGARTRTHTYAVTRAGRWCLYDNIADPYQMKNLVQDPAQRPLMEKLDTMILAWMKDTGDPFPYTEAVKTYSDFPV